MSGVLGYAVTEADEALFVRANRAFPEEKNIFLKFHVLKTLEKDFDSIEDILSVYKRITDREQKKKIDKLRSECGVLAVRRFRDKKR